MTITKWSWGWAAAVALLTLPLAGLAQERAGEAEARPRPADPTLQEHPSRQTSIQGTIVNLEHYLIHGSERAPTPEMGHGRTLAVKTEQGLVILTADSWRQLHERQSPAAARPDRNEGDPGAVAGIERRPEQAQDLRPAEPAAAPRTDAQQARKAAEHPAQDPSATLQASDPDAQFRIVKPGEADRSGQADVYGIERRSAADQSMLSAIGRQATVSGKLFEREGVKLIQVESIRLSAEGARPAGDQPRNP